MTEQCANVTLNTDNLGILISNNFIETKTNYLEIVCTLICTEKVAIHIYMIYINIFVHPFPKKKNFLLQ